MLTLQATPIGSSTLKEERAASGRKAGGNCRVLLLARRQVSCMPLSLHPGAKAGNAGSHAGFSEKLLAVAYPERKSTIP